MFGKNPIRKVDHENANALLVQEIFYTIQGEGPFQGVPAVFVRLAGCSLACFYCDTEFESGMTSAPLSVMEVCDQVVQLMPDHGTERQGLVVLTGGEPMRQDIRELVENLRCMCFDVQIETHGLHYLDFGTKFEAVPATLSDAYRGSLTIVCSPKAGKVNSDLAGIVHHWKYVISEDDSSDADGLPWLSTQFRHQRSQIARPYDYGLLPPYSIWVSPKDEQDPVKNGKNMKKAAEVAMRFGYRLTLQQHKILGLR
jgi:7-carboxy-7-deazaguanine synthase